MTATLPPTTPPTVAHDSTTCGCEICKWANTTVDKGFEGTATALAYERMREHVEQSAATIRARRRALLERAAPDALTDGALALAEAWLCDEAWYRHLPDNAAQDTVVLDLAGEIEQAIGEYLEGRRWVGTAGIWQGGGRSDCE